MVYVTTDPVVTQLKLQVAANGSALATFQVVAYDTDSTLPRRHISCTADWLDGAGPVELGSAEPATPYAPFTSHITRLLPVGKHVVKLTATNRRLPDPDTASKLVYLDVVSETVEPPQPVITGPILPRDEGSPNQDQWNFNQDSDVVLLSSNVKMLLTTRRGDRVMDPTYGVNLDQVVFSLDPSTARLIVQQEVATALAAREPRVKLVSIDVQKLGRDALQIDLGLESKLSRKRFSVAAKITA